MNKKFIQSILFLCIKHIFKQYQTKLIMQQLRSTFYQSAYIHNNANISMWIAEQHKLFKPHMHRLFPVGKRAILYTNYEQNFAHAELVVEQCASTRYGGGAGFTGNAPLSGDYTPQQLVTYTYHSLRK